MRSMLRVLCVVVALAWADEQIAPATLAEGTDSDDDLLQRLAALEETVNKLNAKAADDDDGEDSDQKKCKKDKLNCLFITMKEWSNYYLVPIISSPVSFFLAIILILQWHLRYSCSQLLYDRNYNVKKHKPILWSRRLGINLLIFCLYYADGDGNMTFAPNSTYVQDDTTHETGNDWITLMDDKVVENYTIPANRTRLYSVPAAQELPLPPAVCQWVNGHKFIAILLVIAGEYFFHAILKNASKYKCRLADKELVNPVFDNEDDGVELLRSDATNKYEDLSYKFTNAFALFIVQVFLVFFYVSEMNYGDNADDMKDRTKVDVNYWAVAVILQMFIAEEQLGAGFSAKYWKRVVSAAFTSDTPENDNWLIRRFSADGSPADKMKPDEKDKAINESLKSLGRTQLVGCRFGGIGYRYAWLMRGCMDFTINGFLRYLIMYTFPIMLAVEEPLDFVKDCTAVLFITQLDGIESGSIFLMKICIRLKFAYWWKLCDDDEFKARKEGKGSEKMTDALKQKMLGKGEALKNAMIKNYCLFSREELYYLESEEFDDMKVDDSDPVWNALQEASKETCDPPWVSKKDDKEKGS